MRFEGLSAKRESRDNFLTFLTPGNGTLNFYEHPQKILFIGISLQWEMQWRPTAFARNFPLSKHKQDFRKEFKSNLTSNINIRCKFKRMKARKIEGRFDVIMASLSSKKSTKLIYSKTEIKLKFFINSLTLWTPISYHWESL